MGNLYLKGIDSNRSQSRGIEDFGSLWKELERLKKLPNRVRFKGNLGQSHQPKRHKVLICDAQQNPQEIIINTPLRKSQQTAPEITAKKDGKSNTQP
jgi:hypothetical protein